MHPQTIQQICKVVNGRPVGEMDLNAIVDGCVIDSREVQDGDLFFALNGTHSHGVTFVADAIRNGAAACLVDESESASCDSPHIVVPDCEQALSMLARHNRRSTDALVVGVTGSVGKTTTRGMIAQVLASTHVGIQSPRNFNNHLGVPLSLLEIEEDDEFAVIEVGASNPGETRPLSQMVHPEFSVVTRVAPAHLRGFESLQAVASDKQELVRALSSDGVAFLNADDLLVSLMASETKGRVVTFGHSTDADIRITDVIVQDRILRVTVDGHQYDVPVCGRHLATSVAAAVAIGLEVGISPAVINDGLQRFQPEPGRSVVQTIGPWTVIDDSYNANPASVAAGIQTVEEYTSGRHRIVVLGDMLDLGEQAPDLHFGIGARLASSSVDHVALIGDFAADVVDGFLTSGGDINRISEFSDHSLLLTMLDCIAGDDDVILVKGSRGAAMERVVEQLQTLHAPSPNVSRRAA